MADEGGPARGKTADDIASPCIGVCELDPLTRFCRGCFRTGAEIGAWRDAAADVRRAILHRVSERRRCAGVGELLPAGKGS